MYKTSRLLAPLMFIAGAVLAIGPANGQLITGSPHDLQAAFGVTDICVFCHTPHAATTDAPLWNKPATGSSYTTYDNNISQTLDAPLASDGPGATPAIGSVSLACLTCHDGTQAMDTVINAPGHGFDGAGGATTPTRIGDILVPVDADADIGSIGSSGIADLTTDLSNDHPIGIQYGMWDTSGGAGLVTNDPDFNEAQVASINGADAWWRDTAGGTASVREKSDLILYARDFSGTTAPSVECGSCHDPHDNTNDLFLRIANSGSAVCLTCHNK